MNNDSPQQCQPLVSFIVTYYNLPISMLCACIDSILALSLKGDEREIIVVDDGSDVSPMNGLMHYGDDITYIRQQNGGVSTARNKGIQMAQGAYIQFVDGDDYLQLSAYEHCLDLIRSGNGLEMVLFDFTSAASSQNTFTDHPVSTGTDYMLHHNIHGSAWNYLIRRHTLGNLRFTPGITNGEDEEFTAQLILRVERLTATNAQAYYYRQHKKSVVHQQDDDSKQKRLNDTLTVIRRLNSKISHLPPNDKLAMQRRVAQLTMDYLYNIIMLGQSADELEQRVQELYDAGLFPLPNRSYTLKYTWFRRMSSTKTGRRLLMHTLPLIQRER